MSSPIPAWLKELCELASKSAGWPPDDRYPGASAIAGSGGGDDGQAWLLQMLVNRVEWLQAELSVYLVRKFRQDAYMRRDGRWDTMGSRAAEDIANQLVEFGLWEREPGGQYYRPVAPRVADTTERASKREDRALDALIVSQLRCWEPEEVDIEHLPRLTDEEKAALDSLGPHFVRTLLAANVADTTGG